MASQARHEIVAQLGTSASRIVVPEKRAFTVSASLENSAAEFARHALATHGSADGHTLSRGERAFTRAEKNVRPRRGRNIYYEPTVGFTCGYSCLAPAEPGIQERCQDAPKETGELEALGW